MKIMIMNTIKLVSPMVITGQKIDDLNSI